MSWTKVASASFLLSALSASAPLSTARAQTGAAVSPTKASSGGAAATTPPARGAADASATTRPSAPSTPLAKTSPVESTAKWQHGEKTSAKSAPAVNAGYHKGFFIRGAQKPFELHLGARIQGRFALEAPADGPTEHAFSLPRVRMVLSGHAFTKALTFKFETDFSKGFVVLKDFIANYTLLPSWLQLRVGQWKRPFSRQQIISSSKLELIERAITDGFFGAGRDIGIALHNGYEKSPTFEYALGIFNGVDKPDKPWFAGSVAVDPTTGKGTVSGGHFTNVPDKTHPAIVLRLGYNYGGIDGYTEADRKGGKLRFALGGSALVDFDGDNDDRSSIRAELDYALKAYGFSATGGIYLATRQDGTAFGDQAYRGIGAHLQAGYCIGRYLQPVLRYGILVPDGPDNNRQELMAGLNTYFFEHNFKWQLDGGALINEVPGGKQTDYLVRTQLQFSF